MISPFLLDPVLKHDLWGGTRLTEAYGKPGDRPVSESWELSAHPSGDNRIASGPFLGQTMSQFISRHPSALGPKAAGGLPILIKLICSALPLSVQVHPGDAYARVVGDGTGKTEAWHILDCEEDSFLYIGFNREMEIEEIKRRISDGTIEGALSKIPIKPGETYFIPSGTVHAIGPGITLAEIQQNSNITYRVYDYGRLDKDGKPRELHIEKALEVMQPRPADFTPPGHALTSGKNAVNPIISCDYFTSGTVKLRGSWGHNSPDASFSSLLCLDGRATLSSGGVSLDVEKGRSVFIPAGGAEFRLSGNADLLLTTL